MEVVSGPRMLRRPTVLPVCRFQYPRHYPQRRFDNVRQSHLLGNGPYSLPKYSVRHADPGDRLCFRDRTSGLCPVLPPIPIPVGYNLYPHCLRGVPLHWSSADAYSHVDQMGRFHPHVRICYSHVHALATHVHQRRWQDKEGLVVGYLSHDLL